MGSKRTLRRRSQRKARTALLLDHARWSALTPEQKQAEDRFRYAAEMMIGRLTSESLDLLKNNLTIAKQFYDEPFIAGQQWPDEVRGARVGDTITVARPTLTINRLPKP